MLLTNRRLATLHVCLAGMEIAWFTPLFLLFYGGAAGFSPWSAYGLLLAGLLAWMLALELLSRRLDAPRFELAVLGLILLSAAVAVRVFLHPGLSAGDLGWVGDSARALGDFRAGLRPEWGVLLVVLFLWQRAASASSRDTNFFAVGVSFRLGLLLLILWGTLYSQMRGQNAVPFLWLYLCLGLLAVAVARIHEGALGARSAGSPLAPARAAQLLLAVALVVGLPAWLARYYTASGIRAFLAWLDPLWTALGWVLLRLLWLLFVILWPLLVWLEQQAGRLNFKPLADALQSLSQFLSPSAAANSGAGPALPVWLGVAARDTGIAFLFLLILGFIWLYLERTRRQGLDRESERAAAEELSFGGGILERGLRRLGDLARLVRRFGLSNELLAAVSVQNIYANLCRLARRRGYPRRPAQPPDDYLPVLCRAFAGQDEALARITAAYMRVHYGDRPLAAAELAQVRADYGRVRQAGRAGPVSAARTP